MTKENITRLVSECQVCHHRFQQDEMQGYTCIYCMDMAEEEPSKVAWEDVSDDA